MAEQEFVDPSYVASLLKTVNEDGYVIIPDLIPSETVARIREEAAPFLTYNGRNEIEGHQTRRIYSVIEKTLACNPLIEHPLVLALLDELFMPGYLLSQLQVINVMPGAVCQPPHQDDRNFLRRKPSTSVGG